MKRAAIFAATVAGVVLTAILVAAAVVAWEHGPRVALGAVFNSVGDILHRLGVGG